MRGGGAGAQSAPRFADDHRVLRTEWVVANGGGESEAAVMDVDVLAEFGDVLCGVVLDPADLVLVEEELHGRNGVGRVEDFGEVDQGAVGDASATVEKFAAFAFAFGW